MPRTYCRFPPKKVSWPPRTRVARPPDARRAAPPSPPGKAPAAMAGSCPRASARQASPRRGSAPAGTSAGRCHVALFDALRVRRLADRGVPDLVQQSLVPECPRQRLHQRRVGPPKKPPRRRRSPASSPSSDWVVAGWPAAPGSWCWWPASCCRPQRLGRIAPRSRTMPVSPATRSWMSAPAGPTSTSARTIGAGSPGSDPFQSALGRPSDHRSSPKGTVSASKP